MKKEGEFYFGFIKRRCELFSVVVEFIKGLIFIYL